MLAKGVLGSHWLLLLVLNFCQRIQKFQGIQQWFLAVWNGYSALALSSIFWSGVRGRLLKILGGPLAPENIEGPNQWNIV